MRTRAQKREKMPEMVQHLQSRLRALEEAATGASASASLPTPSKKQKTASSLPPTPPPLNPRLSTFTTLATCKETVKTETNGVKRAPLRRALHYTSPEGRERSVSVLERLCSGPNLCSHSQIVGRVDEHHVISNVLKGDAKEGGCLFLIGPPGTGKSSSVDQVLQEHGYQGVIKGTQRKASRRKVAVKLNCSMFTDPMVLFALAMKHVRNATSWTVPEEFDLLELNKFLESQSWQIQTNDPTVVVVLDEVDQLLRLPVRTQAIVKDVVRFFVRWATAVPNAVKFIGIMNGLDMFQHISTIHVTRQEDATASLIPHVVFGSYSHHKLLLILQNYIQTALPSNVRIQETETFIEPRAIELLARKVAARDGDARLAISLLQQSARHALQRSKATSPDVQAKLTLRDVFQCVTSMLSSSVVQQIKHLPRQAKILLYVITALGTNQKNRQSRTMQPCDMNQVNEELTRLRDVAATAWVPRFSREELQTHLMSLDCYAMIRQGGKKRGEKTSRVGSLAADCAPFWTMKISSCVTMADVTAALKDDTSLCHFVVGLINVVET